MMNKRIKGLIHPATFCFVGMWLVVLVSWIADIYGIQVCNRETGEVIRVQSLLSPEGIRWWVRSAVDNFNRYISPGWVLVLSLGIGVAIHAFADYKPRSRKNRRALTGALLTGGIYFLLILLATCSPWGILRGANGELWHSPFMEGFPFLFSLGIGLVGIVYGFASGRYRRDRDVMAGLTYLMPFLGVFFVIAFFASQWMGCLDYTRLDEVLKAIWQNLFL